MYKPKRFLITLLIFFSLFSIYAKPLAEKPDWIENWRTIYPDSVYIAQLGKATGKNGNAEIKTIATNMIAQYIKTNVQSQLSSSMETKTTFVFFSLFTILPSFLKQLLRMDLSILNII